MEKKTYPSREERMKDLSQRLEQGIRGQPGAERQPVRRHSQQYPRRG